MFRETKRKSEIEQLVSQGKIPHDEELVVNPDKSAPGRMCM